MKLTEVIAKVMSFEAKDALLLNAETLNCHLAKDVSKTRRESLN